MNQNKSFKSTVLEALISNSKIYFNNFVTTEYLIYSENFIEEKFYTITAKKDNYLHLTGVKTPLNANQFFDKCFNGTLKEDDFDLGNTSLKGSIRRKVKVLPKACSLFLNGEILVEEKFIKNQVSCSFASTDKDCTLGFCLSKNSKPLTLLKGNQLKSPMNVDLIMKKSIDENKFTTIVLNKLSDEAFDKVMKMLETHSL